MTTNRPLPPLPQYTPTIEENFTAAVLHDEYISSAATSTHLGVLNTGLALAFTVLSAQAVLSSKPLDVLPAFALLHAGLAVNARHNTKTAKQRAAHCLCTHDFNSNSYRPILKDHISELLGAPAQQSLRARSTTALLIGVEAGLYYAQLHQGYTLPWDLMIGFKALASGSLCGLSLIGSGCSFLKSMETPLAAGFRAQHRFNAEHSVRFF